MDIDNEPPRESSSLPMSPPVISLLEDMAEAAIAKASTLMEDAEGLPEDGTLSDSLNGAGYVFMTEEERWEDGMQALEDFDWDSKGSQWLDGRGLVSVHYDEVGKSTAVFKGNYWDDVEVERLFPGAEEDPYAPPQEEAMNLTGDA